MKRLHEVIDTKSLAWCQAHSRNSTKYSETNRGQRVTPFTFPTDPDAFGVYLWKARHGYHQKPLVLFVFSDPQRWTRWEEAVTADGQVASAHQENRTTSGGAVKRRSEGGKKSFQT